MQSAMLVYLLSSKPFNLNPLTLEILYPLLVCGHMHYFLSLICNPSCCSTDCYNLGLWIFLTCFGILFVDWSCFCTTCLLLLLDFCAWLRMTNLINVPRLKCIASWVFTITPEVVVANTLVLLILACSFRWCQKGENYLTMLFNLSKGLVNVLIILLLLCLSGCI